MEFTNSVNGTTELRLRGPWGGLIRVFPLLVLAAGMLPAQTFAPVAGLNFTKAFSGADPLPQTLTIASSGAAFNFTRTSATTTGGAWLTVSNQSWNGCNICATPTTLTVIVNPSLALAAGSYSGQITVTSSPGSTTMVIPITLTVTPPGSALFDNLPGQLSFFMKTSGAAPASQKRSIRNGGAGTLNWTLSSTTAHGSGWLGISSTSGTAPSEITFSINKASLPGGGNTAGTYIGRLLFQTASGNVTVPFSIVVGDNVFQQVNPLSFTKLFGGANPLPQTLTIASTGTTFNFTTAKATATGGDWLTVSNVSWNGCILCGTPETIRVAINPSAALAAGTYTGQVVITSQIANQAMTIPVTMFVAAPGSTYFDNAAGQLSFSMKTAGTTMPNQTVQIRGIGGALSWTGTAVTADGGAWLTMSSTSGTAPSALTIGVVVNNLPNAGLLAGTFVALLEFKASGSSITIPVAVTVGDSVISQVNPISFVKQFGGANPLPQTINFGNPGTSFNFTISSSTATGGSWLTTDNVSWNGCNLCGTPQSIRVIINAAPTLPIGTYTGQVVATAQTGFMSITVPVTLTVTAAGATGFDSLPGQMSFSFKTGEAAPPTQSVQLRNAGSGTINWTLVHTTSDGGNWLLPSIASGTAPSLVHVGIDKNSLPGGGLLAGTFTGQLAFLTESGNVTIPVVVIVGDAVFQQVNALQFTKLFQGPDPLPQTFMVTSPGAGFNFTVNATTSTGGAWLSVVNESWNGCNLCGMPQGITVKVNPAVGLAAGTYTGQIVATAQSGFTSMTIPVTLTIATSGVAHFDDLPGQLAFSFKTAEAAPPGQIFQIRNAGAGSLAWTLAATTADNGNWLVVSSTSGTAPSKVTVSINKNNLPGLGLLAGTFTGQLLLASSGGNMTIPIVVSVADDVFRQVNPLHFVMQAGGANPLKQTVTVASTGASFNFTAAKYTATGGNWFNVTNESWNGCGLCGMPQNLTVSMTASPAMPAGTYTGEIILTAQNGTRVMTIPVTLTVAATGAFFDNTAGAVSFFALTASGNPASQTVQLRNRGAGSLAWTLIASTSDGGAWLTTSATSGTATNSPSTVTIGVNVAALPGLGLIPGTFTGQLLFQTPGGDITVPVSLVVGTGIFTQLPGRSFSGASPPSQTIDITSNGANFNFTYFANTGVTPNWLSVSASGSCNLCAMPRTLTASVNTAGLSGGTYVGQIVATAQNGTLAITIPVILTISGPPPPASVTVVAGTPQSTPINTAFPNPLSVIVRDAGSNPLSNITVTFTPPASGASGAFAGSNTAVTNVSGIATSSTFTANGVAGGPYNVAATVSGVATPANFSLTNTTCSYNLSANSANPTAAGGASSVNVITTTGCPWTAVSSAAWITVTSGSSGNGNGTVGYTVAANPSVSPRSSAITIAGKVFIVNQAGLGCSYGLSATSANPVAAGGAASVNVIATTGCPWTAVSNAPWITVTSGASGNGNGTVGYTVAGNTSVQRVGTITIAGLTFTVTQQQPTAGDVTVGVTPPSPTSGTGNTQTFIFNFSDTDGAADLNVLNVLINNAIDGRFACYIAFVRSSGTLFLVNDAGQAGGPFAGSITIPGAGTVSNSQCTINATGSSVLMSGNSLALTLNITFTPAFSGRRVMYVAARDTIENNTGWHALGVWTVPFAAPPTYVSSMTPARTQSNAVILTTTFSDVDGFADLNVLNILINDGIDGRNACYIAYVRPARTLFLVNDAGEAGGPFAGSIPIPGTGIVSNSQCSIDATGSSLIESGNTVTLTLNLSFHLVFRDRLIFAAAHVYRKTTPGWQAMATLTVP
ncbi:MAG: BACON domain-containing carbohydrate-binding protein [Bryobacteraceae bacterium]